MPNHINNKRITNGWAFYDWANSVFPLVMTAAIFPVFYLDITQNAFNSEFVNILGINIKNSVIYELALSASFLIIAIISPLLSGIADFTGNKKGFMRFFVYIGSISTSFLFLFNGQNVFLGLTLLAIGNIGFNGSLVFYNSYLPEISSKDKMDQLSAKGFALGYIGSVFLLIICIAIISLSGQLGLSGNTPYYFSFLLVGLWWFGFSHITFKSLPTKSNSTGFKRSTLTKGYLELLKVWNELKNSNNIKLFLLSFFFLSMGVQTVIYVASIYGKKELGIETSQLIIAILLIQIIAIIGAYIFSNISKLFGNITSLSISIILWVIVCFLAYFIQGSIGFFVVAGMVGLVMGGTQSIARSTYSKLIPTESNDNTSFFSFYEFSEKIAIVLGTWSYAIIESITGNMRTSVLVLATFFIVAFTVIRFVKMPSATKLHPGH